MLHNGYGAIGLQNTHDPWAGVAPQLVMDTSRGLPQTQAPIAFCFGFWVGGEGGWDFSASKQGLLRHCVPPRVVPRVVRAKRRSGPAVGDVSFYQFVAAAAVAPLRAGCAMRHCTQNVISTIIFCFQKCTLRSKIIPFYETKYPVTAGTCIRVPWMKFGTRNRSLGPTRPRSCFDCVVVVILSSLTGHKLQCGDDELAQ
jgi:hypothetical protein